MRRENVYLGKTVPDIGKPGLDKLAEVRGIALKEFIDYVRRELMRERPARRYR